MNYIGEGKVAGSIRRCEDIFDFVERGLRMIFAFAEDTESQALLMKLKALATIYLTVITMHFLAYDLPVCLKIPSTVLILAHCTVAQANR